MLSRILQDKMKNDGLSARAVSRQVGVAHTTVLRLLDDETVDLSTLMKVADWLGVSVADITDVGTKSADLAQKLAVLIEQEPRLKSLFTVLVSEYEGGRLTSKELEDVLAYAKFKIKDKETQPGD
jgi:transcriptional regulator with XRE-family HTH domain